jgi:putative oxidoreductase
MLFSSQERGINLGLLLMRIGLAAMLLIHSLPRLIDGAAQWKSVGATVSYVNIGLPLQVLGFVVLLMETLGGVSLLCGYLFRTACIILTLLFGLYFFNYISIGYRTLTLFSLGLASVFIGLINTGPGRYAVAVKLEKK